MASKNKMLIIPCSGEETTKLAKDIFSILRQYHGLEGQVEFLDCLRRSDVPIEMPKNHLHDLVTDYFADAEAQSDIGRNQLKDVIRGKHVVLVEHLLTPNRRLNPQDEQKVSVNDHIMTVRGMLDLLSKTEVPCRTLAAPYLTYVRSHSIEKYQERGFFQFDSLRRTLKDYRADGLDVLITIDPHSEKAAQIASELGLDFHSVNPFQSGRSINPYKIGLTDQNAQEVMKQLRPFQERFDLLRKQYGDHLYIVSVDSGTEKRTENFTERAFQDLPPQVAYSRLAYLFKDRIAYGNSKSGFKQFSQINEKNIDPEGVYIMIDDMFFTGGSANAVAEKLKKFGAKRVEAWNTHLVAMPLFYEKVNNRQFLDALVFLDTVPQSPELQVEFIPASAHLLAAELYKAHNKFVSKA